MGDRYTVGTGGPDEPGLILVGDTARHVLFLRGSEQCLPAIGEMVRLANSASKLLAVAKAARELCVTVLGEVQAENVRRWAEDVFTRAEAAITEATKESRQ